MKFPISRRRKGSQDGDAPSRSATFSSLETQFSSLGLGSAFKKKKKNRPATPPPPYADATASPVSETTRSTSATRDLMNQKTWQTVESTASSADTTVAEKVEEAILEEKLIDKATSFATPPSPGPNGEGPRKFPRLQKPVAVPRLHPGPNFPFTRAWAPCMADYSIDQTAFLTFIDNLNLVTAPHPTIKLIDAAAFGLQFVPVPYSDALSGALQIIAAVTTVAVAYHRSRRYFARLNAEFFEPRGLHAMTMGTRQLKACLGIDKTDTLLAPLTEKSLDLSGQQRCLKRLEEWVAPIETEGLPPPSPETDLLARFTAWRIRHKIRMAEKYSKRQRRRAWKKHMKGKKLKESWIEKKRVKGLSWIVIRNLDDVLRERGEKQAQKEANPRRQMLSDVGYCMMR